MQLAYRWLLSSRFAAWASALGVVDNVVYLPVFGGARLVGWLGGRLAGTGAAYRGLLKRFDRRVTRFLGGFEATLGLGQVGLELAAELLFTLQRCLRRAALELRRLSRRALGAELTLKRCAVLAGVFLDSVGALGGGLGALFGAGGALVSLCKLRRKPAGRQICAWWVLHQQVCRQASRLRSLFHRHEAVGALWLVVYSGNYCPFLAGPRMCAGVASGTILADAQEGTICRVYACTRRNRAYDWGHNTFWGVRRARSQGTFVNAAPVWSRSGARAHGPVRCCICRRRDNEKAYPSSSRLRTRAGNCRPRSTGRCDTRLPPGPADSRPPAAAITEHWQDT